MLKKKYFIIVIVVCVLFLFSCDLDVSYDDGYSFYLTEVSTSGSVGGLSVDYIELYNSTDEDIDLTGYYFGDSEDIEDCYLVGSNLSTNEWDSDATDWTTTTTTTETTVIPANGYLIILFSNDFAITDAVSKTILETWTDGEDTQTVEASFAGNEYLTIPAGLKASKAEGVYIYDGEESEVTNSFTYEEDEQGNDTVFLYEDGTWSQGTASPGEANE